MEKKMRYSAIADGVMMLVVYVCQKLLLNLFGTVFRYFAERGISALIAFKKYVEHAKYHYANQCQLTGKDKPFQQCT